MVRHSPPFSKFDWKGPMSQDQVSQNWKCLVKIHNYTKALLLMSEEIDLKHEFYYPPLIQQRDALDHIMRAMFAQTWPEEFEEEFGPDGYKPDEYTPRQLDKAIGHAYRALYDICDWLSIIYRERIREILGSYSRKTIIEKLPEFSTTTEPRIDTISIEISKLRGSKDIAKADEVIKGVSEYKALLIELEGYWRKVQEAVPELDSAEFPEAQNSDSV